jgi:hypothetical protein
MSAYHEAKRKARYGRKDWLVWTNKEGIRVNAIYNAVTLKQCLLDSGTQGEWWLIAKNSGLGYVGSWYMGVMMIRNSRYA